MWNFYVFWVNKRHPSFFCRWPKKVQTLKRTSRVVSWGWCLGACTFFDVMLIRRFLSRWSLRFALSYLRKCIENKCTAKNPISYKVVDGNLSLNDVFFRSILKQKRCIHYAVFMYDLRYHFNLTFYLFFPTFKLWLYIQ